MIDENRFSYTKRRLAEGASQRKIALELGVDHSTISYWIRNGFNSGTRRSPEITDIEVINQCSLHAAEYAYILGSYLGDGYIIKMPRTYKMTIYNDNRYPDVIQDQTLALSKLFPSNTVSHLQQHRSRCLEIKIHNKSLPHFFPQHGTGKKHNRDVSLRDWQWDIVWKEPECFIKGLIDSDGSHCIHQQIINGVNYSRMKYQFTNKSLDIVDMYLKVMARLNISAKPTQRNTGTFNVFTNRSTDVEKLDNLYIIAENKLRN